MTMRQNTLCPRWNYWNPVQIQFSHRKRKIILKCSFQERDYRGIENLKNWSNKLFFLQHPPINYFCNVIISILDISWHPLIICIWKPHISNYFKLTTKIISFSFIQHILVSQNLYDWGCFYFDEKMLICRGLVLLWMDT